MTTSAAGRLLWTPAAAFKQASRLQQYMDWLRRSGCGDFADYAALWQWSVTDLEGFWGSIASYFDVRLGGVYPRVLEHPQMPGARWFAGAELNYVEQVFRHGGGARPAILYASETQAQPQALSWDELERRTAALAHSLRELGVVKGDRVAAYLPNIPETIVAFLAVASIGAIWSGCAPEMGQTAVLDRFRQIEPKVLIAVDGYRYGGKACERAGVVEALCRQLPTLRHLIVVPCLDVALTPPAPVQRHTWADLLQAPVPLQIERVPFDHPLWIVYSSGTTGLPKPIVHGHGGITLEQLKQSAFHYNVDRGDIYHWYSSTAWIVWNAQVGLLLLGVTIAVYDGNPAYPDLNRLWQFVEDTGATFFGAGAAYFTSCMKAGLEPRHSVDLSRLKTVASTGSPLPAEAYEWIYRAVGEDIWLTPVSGGTDFAGAFVGGCPLLPVYAGEMQSRALGASVHAFDADGTALVGAVGELVCTAPMPSMPLYFWNDTGNVRYRDSYFDLYPGVWRHGDWIEITARGGAVIYGRSDATINRHGVRMGTAELYRVVEELPEVLDSLVVDLEYLGRESYLPLFVVLRAEAVLDDGLRDTINARIRAALSARHVPSAIFQVPDIPRTLTGKKLEVPIKKLLLGHAAEKIVNRDAMANPASLDWFIEFAGEYIGRAPHTV